ncbi:MAG: IS1595 family transposase [Acidimicrobiaceae bacterium]|nr:IS1595 family transposase [Acidimicrobiia bacterium]MCY4493970.1 IS1595 family transposase [Acidimicrobiaceae bacterium]
MSDENTVQTKAPCKAFRKGMTLVELIRKFPDNKMAEVWFTAIRWPDGPECPRCGCDNVQYPTSHKTVPCRCRGKGCRRFFSVRVGTVVQDSKLGCQEWAIAVYLFSMSLKSVLSMKLHCDLGISQKSAWHLAHRICQCCDDIEAAPFAGPVEADESHFGGQAKNMQAKVRRERTTGRGAVDKTTVVGVRDRVLGKVAASVVDNTDAATLQGFVNDHAGVHAMVYTDERKSYRGLPRHETVRHSVAEYVNGQAHVNGVESFWAALKRDYLGTFHYVSPEHPDRYVCVFAGRHNRRPMDTEDMMAESVRGMVGRRLTYTELVGASS